MASTEEVTRTVEKLTSVPTVIELPSGRKVEVLVCKTRHLPTLLRLLATVFEPLNLKMSQKPKPGEITALLDNVGFVLNIAAANFPLVMEAARTLTTLKGEELDEMDIDDMVVLVDAIIRRNYDFFMQRLLPAMSKYLPVLSGPDEENGKPTTESPSTLASSTQS